LILFFFSAARYAQELVSFMKEKNLNPFKNLLVPLAQVCMFISVFNPLTPELNPSAQCCLLRFFTGDFNF
jgi:hypothetical protein